MIAWWWLLPFMAVAGFLGWQVKTLRVEDAEFADERRRDEEWDRQHGASGGSEVNDVQA